MMIILKIIIAICLFPEFSSFFGICREQKLLKKGWRQ